MGEPRLVSTKGQVTKSSIEEALAFDQLLENRHGKLLQGLCGWNMLGLTLVGTEKTRRYLSCLCGHWSARLQAWNDWPLLTQDPVPGWGASYLHRWPLV